MCKKIVLVGGGTGGHATPLVNLVEFLLSRQKEGNRLTINNFLWIGEKQGIEEILAKKNNIPFSPIICGKLRRYFSLRTLLLPFQTLIGTIQSLIILIKDRPNSIFSKGGYVSIPVAIAGWLLRIPIILHESDAVAGLANRIVGRFATSIFCSFDEAKSCFPSHKIRGIGPLLPLGLIEVMTYYSRKRQEKSSINILVSCGSQGSSSIFEALVDVLTKHKKLSTIHFHIVLGTNNQGFKDAFSQFPNVSTYEFFYDQKQYFQLAKKCDLVITRSSSSVFEFEALGLHMIMIPHPYTGNNHQYWNAKVFEKKGHILLPQSELSKLGVILENIYNFTKIPSKIENNSSFDIISRELLR